MSLTHGSKMWDYNSTKAGGDSRTILLNSSYNKCEIMNY